MTNHLSRRNTFLTALLIGFLGTTAIGGCAGMTDDGEEPGTYLTPDQTYDGVRNGARLILRYAADADAFVGTVENTTGATLPKVRVEVHLSNGTELGPTTPMDLAPGATIDVKLPAAGGSFTGWTAHAEVGTGHGAGGEEGGEHGSGREARGEHR